jgi:hypothetical protein
MADLSAVSAGDGIAFLVSYGIVAEIIAKACSSPQTAELNADKRAATLMKWVWIGVAESVAAVAVAAYIDKKHRPAIIWGGGLAIVVTLSEYQYAKNSGLRNGGPATESY